MTLLLTVSGFSNANLVNVSYIEIINAKGDWLQVSEVIANDIVGNDMALTNFAIATAPNQWSSISGAEQSIDGVTAGSYQLGQIFHELTRGSTLTVTFNALQELSSFTIFGRTDCCTERDIYDIRFFGADSQVIATYTDVAPGTLVPIPEPTILALIALGIISLASRKPIIM